MSKGLSLLKENVVTPFSLPWTLLVDTLIKVNSLFYIMIIDYLKDSLDKT